MKQQEIELINVENVIKSKAPHIYSKTPRFLIRYLERKIHQNELNEILTVYADKEGVEFMQSVVSYFNLQLEIDGLDKISTDDRYIFASNHPLGGLDGICLSAIIGEKFDNRIKYLVNDLLLNIRNLRTIFVPVNKHGGQSRQGVNVINETFHSDNQIITFPAGLCSRKIKGKIVDLEWKKTVIDKAKESKRNIVPVYFEAKNSNFFYRLANIRQRLGFKFNFEMLFLPDEMFKNKNQVFTIRFGTPISWRFFDDTKTSKEWANYLKNEVYDLAKNKR